MVVWRTTVLVLNKMVNRTGFDKHHSEPIETIIFFLQNDHASVGLSKKSSALLQPYRFNTTGIFRICFIGTNNLAAQDVRSKRKSVVMFAGESRG